MAMSDSNVHHPFASDHAPKRPAGTDRRLALSELDEGWRRIASTYCAQLFAAHESETGSGAYRQGPAD